MSIALVGQIRIMTGNTVVDGCLARERDHRECACGSYQQLIKHFAAAIGKSSQMIQLRRQANIRHRHMYTLYIQTMHLHIYTLTNKFILVIYSLFILHSNGIILLAFEMRNLLR